MRPHRFSICLPATLAVTLFVASHALAQASSRALVPGVAAQAEAMSLVKEVYKADYDKARTATERQSLAKKMLGKAAESTGDPAGYFVLLKLARDIAAQAGDGQTAMQAVDELSKAFQVDGLEMKVGILDTLSKKARLPADHKSLVEQALALIDEAVAQDKFELADKLGVTALGSVRQAGASAVAKQLRSRMDEVKEAATAFERVKMATETLESKPSDPEANLIVGKYTCLVKGDWDRGLPMLALGSDATLKAVAMKELEGAATPDEQVKLADGWWALAEKEEGTAKKQLQGRAGMCYRQALPKLSGLVKDKVEKRLSNLVALPTAQPKSTMVRNTQGTPKAQGSDTSQVVARGLDWLARQQAGDGSWTFTVSPNPGGHKSRMAATAMSVLPFLRAIPGKTTNEHRAVVSKGLDFIGKRMSNGGDLRDGDSMYVHALGAIALCEAYAHSKDVHMRAPTQAAVDFIVYAQSPKDGGWRYQPRSEVSGTSVAGWQLTALKIARDAKLQVPQETLRRASGYLDSVQADGGRSYRYTREAPEPSISNSAIGLLCRSYLGWNQTNPILREGAKKVMEAGFKDDNLYFNYYATCLMHRLGGEEWQRWQAGVREKIVSRQNMDGNDLGSWSPDGDQYGKQWGRLGQTALSLVTLEIGNE